MGEADYVDTLVPVEVRVPCDEAQHRLLNGLWGYPDGNVPLDITGPSPHRDAAYRVSAQMVVTVRLRVRIYKSGERRVLATEIVS